MERYPIGRDEDILQDVNGDLAHEDDRVGMNQRRRGEGGAAHRQLGREASDDHARHGGGRPQKEPLVAVR